MLLLFTVSGMVLTWLPLIQDIQRTKQTLLIQQSSLLTGAAISVVSNDVTDLPQSYAASFGAAIVNAITLSAQTHRNSEYTVFIRMGSMGGNKAVFRTLLLFTVSGMAQTLVHLNIINLEITIMTSCANNMGGLFL